VQINKKMQSLSKWACPLRPFRQLTVTNRQHNPGGTGFANLNPKIKDVKLKN